MNMEKLTKVQILKKVFSFNLYMFDFCDDLIANRKKIFADKIVHSSLVGTLNLQLAFDTDRESIRIPALKKATREFRNAIYWIKLYEKASTYKTKEEFIKMGEEVYEFCEETFENSKKN